MNTTSPTKKEGVTKSLAIVGLIALVLIIAWLSVQIVSIAPSAFASLASTINGVREYEEVVIAEETPVTLALKSDIGTQKSGDPVALMWTQPDAAGTFTLTYNCQDGVAVDVLEVAGLKSIDCATAYDLGNTNNATVIIDSEKATSTSIAFLITFTAENADESTLSESSIITVTNDTLLATEVPTEGVVSGVATTTATTTPPTSPAPIPAPAPVPVITYAIPVSNPNGNVDLTARFLNSGEIVNNQFRLATIRQNGQGALQFEVKNIGTKTSENWTYSVTLPNQDIYRSDVQAPLKPNERAVIAIGFQAENTSTHTFTVRTNTAFDAVVANNAFSRVVPFIR
jgi:hypothetical protein